MEDLDSFDVDEPVRRRILLIDDDRLIAEMYAAALGRSGNDVRVAVGGLAGLAAAREADFDLVLLDIAMPDLDGMEVLARLRDEARTQRWPVVMFTNSDDTALRNRACHLGARDYVVKTSIMPMALADFVVTWTNTCG